MKNTKRLLAILICAVMVFSCVQISALAVVPLRYNYVEKKECSFSISGANSTSKAKLYATKKMELSVTMELQKLKSGEYKTIETWSESKTATSIEMSETRIINVLSTYRLKVTFEAGNETIVCFRYAS